MSVALKRHTHKIKKKKERKKAREKKFDEHPDFPVNKSVIFLPHVPLCLSDIGLTGGDETWPGWAPLSQVTSRHWGYIHCVSLCPWQKFLELAKQVGEFITWKQVECPFEQDPSITHYLHTAPIFSEDGKVALKLPDPQPRNS